MGTIEVEIGDPYEAMLEELEEEDGFDKGIRQTLENIIHRSYQDNNS